MVFHNRLLCVDVETAMMSEDSDYTSDVSFPVQQQQQQQQQQYYVSGPGSAPGAPDDIDAYCGYYTDDMGDYLLADRRYYYAPTRVHPAVPRADGRWYIEDRYSGGRDCYWNGQPRGGYQRQCDWEQEPLSYNSRPPRYHSCHRSLTD